MHKYGPIIHWAQCFLSLFTVTFLLLSWSPCSPLWRARRSLWDFNFFAFPVSQKEMSFLSSKSIYYTNILAKFVWSKTSELLPPWHAEEGKSHRKLSPQLIHHTPCHLQLCLRSGSPISTKWQPFDAIVTLLLFFSHVWLLVIPWTTARQGPLSRIISWNFLKFMSIESVMLSNRLILCHLLLLLPSVFLSIRVFSSELALCNRWPKYWSFTISPSSEYLGLISFRIDW